LSGGPYGKILTVAPLAVADLPDHAEVANDDNMHDLCLPRLPRGAKLTGVTIGGGLIEDPDGNPKVPRNFWLPRPVG
jgi:hypothetical protein